MKIKELKGLRHLMATPTIIRMVAEDTPVRMMAYSGDRYSFKCSAYMRCKIQHDILIVAFYLPVFLRAGARLPSYELFIHRVSGQFITFDRQQNRWRSATLYNLGLPYDIWNAGSRWISKSDHKRIQTYLGGDKGGIDGLCSYQQKIRDEALKMRHKKETDPWDLDLSQVPELPKDWYHWANKVGIPQNYIYYQYQKKGADTGYCTYCERDVPIKQPRHNKEGRCPRCRRKIVFKSVGMAGNVVTDTAFMYLLQRCKDGFVVREFTGFRKYPKGGYKLPEITVNEIRRALFDPFGKPLRAYRMGLYKLIEYRWIRCGVCNPGWPGEESGHIYGKTLPSLIKSELSHSGLIETLSYFGKIDPELYLAVLHETPLLEKLAKAKLPRLVHECLSNCLGFKDEMSDANATELTKILGISTQALKRLRDNSGGLRSLQWLRYERETGKALPDAVIGWYIGEKITPGDIGFIKDRMSAVQVHNYIRRQMSENQEPSRGVLNTWADYLSMATRLKMDTGDEIIFRVNKLYQRHDELVELCQQKSLEIEADRILDSYPHVNDVCSSLKAKYEYANEDYAVVVPSGVLDILIEGRDLHHCVDKSTRYWERIERRESYILFLRRTAEPEKSYYTLEVEPNGTIRQKRTMYDRQNADIEDATKFLAEWQRAISGRLDVVDFELARESHILREQNFELLRENKAIIHTGDLAGRLLVDVLMADLMENDLVPIAA